MTFYALSALINGIISTILGLFIFSRDKNDKRYITFSLFSLSVAFWSYFYFLWQITSSYNTALWSCRGLMAGAIFIPVCYVHHLSEVFNINSKYKKVIHYGYFGGIFFLLIDLITPFFVKNVSPKLVFKFWPEAGILFLPFLILWASYVLYGVFIIIIQYKNTIGASKNQVKYILLATFIGWLGGATNYPLWYNIPILPVGNILVSGYMIILTYAILRYRVLDINLALTRAGIFAVVYALVLGIPLGLTGWGRFWLEGLFAQNWYWAPVILAIVLATAGPFIFLFLQRRAEKLLRKEQLSYQQALRSISSTMMLNKDLDKLLRSIVLNIVDIVKVEWAAVYLKDDKAQKYFLKHQSSQAQSLIMPAEFVPDSGFIRHLYNSRLPLIGEELHYRELKVGLAVPCFLDSNMVGFLLLGNKPKGVIYDQSDVNEFTLLANQTALAIENCQFYTKERQQEHFRRISSLDNQISWMAHEMDNPIHATLSVLGTIDIALDELVGTIPVEKMEYLKQKLSRVEFNALRVSKMISAVKEFTKPTTGEFNPVTLQQIVASFEAILQPQIRHFGIDFTVSLPAEPVWLRVNKVEIEQVLVNLGTNSVQAINELWQDKRRTAQGKKEMSLTAYIMEKTLRIDLKDTGGGIEEKLLEDIFLDFVTTKASTVGTGLGLAIARKIISRHKGKIWAESEGAGCGATFHIELPVAEDISEEEKIKFSDGQNESKRRDMI